MSITATLLALAAGASVTPNADTANMARACATTMPAEMWNEDPFDDVGQFSYYASIVAAYDPKGQPFDVRMQALSADFISGMAIDGEAPVATEESCDAAFPKARLSSVTIPSTLSDFDRDALCLASASMLIGAAEPADGNMGYPELLSRYQAIESAYLTQLTDARMAQHGYTDANAATSLLMQQFGVMLDIGNARAIAHACEGSGMTE